MDSSEVLMQSLADSGVEYAFGLPGSVIMNTIDKITQIDELDFISTRHEQVATSMADGYARVTNRPGVSLAHVGPGAANQVIGVAAAYRDASPLIAISGNEDLSRLGRNIWHEWDVSGVFERFTKWNTQISNSDDAARIARQALVKSVAGRPGPIHIDLPKDVSQAESSYSEAEREFYENHEISVPFDRPRPDRNRVRETIRLIREAERPIFLAGGGCAWSGGGEVLLQVAERLGTPVVTSNSGRGVIPETHPLSLGLVGIRGSDAANAAVDLADMVIGVGARFSGLTMDNWRIVDETDTLVQVDVHPDEFASQYPVDVAIQADALAFLNALADELTSDGVRGIFPEGDAKDAKEAVEKERAAFLDYPEQDAISAGQFVKTVEEEKDDDAIMTVGGGVHMVFNIKQRAFDPHSHLHMLSFGSMGFGFPLAMGAKLGRPDRQVVCVEGDGGFAMVMQDLETAVRYDLDVNVIIYNNFSHGTQKLRQARFFDERYLGTDVDNPPFDELARTFGAYGARVERPQDLRPAVKELLAHDGPGVLDVIVDPWEWPETKTIAQI